MKCKCGSDIPVKRFDMGYKVCVECSTESRWTVVPVNYHKTGNTAEIIKDPEVAADFMFMSSRKGFGVMRGMTSGRKRQIHKQPLKEPKKDESPALVQPRILSRHMPTYYFEEVGEKAMNIAENESIDRALQYIEEALNENLIYKKQADQIIQIINTITQSWKTQSK